MLDYDEALRAYGEDGLAKLLNMRGHSRFAVRRVYEQRFPETVKVSPGWIRDRVQDAAAVRKTDRERGHCLEVDLLWAVIAALAAGAAADPDGCLQELLKLKAKLR